MVDLGGAYVIPGLIDSHQHLATPPNRPVAEAGAAPPGLRRRHRHPRHGRRPAPDRRPRPAPPRRRDPRPRHPLRRADGRPGFFDDPRTWQVSQGETPGARPVDAGDRRRHRPAARRGHGARHPRHGDQDLRGPARRPVAAITAEAHRQGIGVWAHAAVFPAPSGGRRRRARRSRTSRLLAGQTSRRHAPTRYQSQAADGGGDVPRRDNPHHRVLSSRGESRGARSSTRPPACGRATRGGWPTRTRKGSTRAQGQRGACRPL